MEGEDSIYVGVTIYVGVRIQYRVELTIGRVGGFHIDEANNRRWWEYSIL